jgi:hypothetical protein
VSAAGNIVLLLGCYRCAITPARTETLDVTGLEFRQALKDGLGRPIPPRNSRKLRGEIAVEALPDLFGGNTAHDGVGRDIAGHHGTGRQHGAIADRNARHHDDGVTDPDIVADLDAIGAAVPEEGVISLCVGRVVFRTISETMLRRAVERMVWRADADLCGDRAKFSDPGVRDHAARTEIRVIAKFSVFDRGIAEHLAAEADADLAQFD